MSNKLTENNLKIEICSFPKIVILLGLLNEKVETQDMYRKIINNIFQREKKVFKLYSKMEKYISKIVWPIQNSMTLIM